MVQWITIGAYVFVVAAYAVKVVRALRMPPHLRWELYPIPHEENHRYGGSYFETPGWWRRPRRISRVRDLARMLKNYLFFGSYLRWDRSYWAGLYTWHIGFYFILLFHVLSFVSALVAVNTGVAGGAEPAGLGADVFRHIMTVMGATGFAAGAAGSILLLARRTLDPKMRAYTRPSNYFTYVFFLVVFVSGLVSWYPFDPSLTSYREFWYSLVQGQYVEVEPALNVHLLLFALFLVYLPFTRSTHYITKLIAFFSVRWDDTPNSPGSRMRRRIEQALSQPVGWEAEHVQPGTRWRDVAQNLPDAREGADRSSK